jgi:hypothetical protein
MSWLAIWGEEDLRLSIFHPFVWEERELLTMLCLYNISLYKSTLSQHKTGETFCILCLGDVPYVPKSITLALSVNCMYCRLGDLRGMRVGGERGSFGVERWGGKWLRVTAWVAHSHT